MAQVYTFTDSNGEVRLQAEINPAPGGGSSPVLTATATLTNAQILALPSTPVTLVAGQAGKAIIPTFAVYQITTGADAYTGIDPADYLTIGTGNDNAELTIPVSFTNLVGTSIDRLQWTLAAVRDVTGTIVTTYQTVADLNGIALTLSLSSGGIDYGGGDVGNTLRVTCYYVVVTVA